MAAKVCAPGKGAAFAAFFLSVALETEAHPKRKDGADLWIIKKTTGCVVLAGIAMHFLIGVQAADAHRVSVWAYAEDDMICAECKFSNGRRVIDGTIRVYDDRNRLLMEGTTGPEGRYCFEAPEATGVRIVLKTG
jgi:hypothetical protein